MIQGRPPALASAEIKAEGLCKPTGRIYQQAYVLFVRVENGKPASSHACLDPARAAIALDAPESGWWTERCNLLENGALRYPNGAAPCAGHRRWRTCGPSRI